MIRQVLLACGILLTALAPAQAAVSDLNFTVNTSEAVVVNTAGGTPRLQLNVGGVTRYATYASGSNTSALTFTYSPVAGDVDLDGIAIASTALDLNGGTVTDLAGNALSPLTFTAPNTSNIKINYPALSLDFVADRYTLNGTAYTPLSSFISSAGASFTRTSTATYFNSAGILQTAAANTPRFDYDPTTLTARGLMIEEARTNYVPDSQYTTLTTGSSTSNANWRFYCPGAVMPGCSISVTGTGSQNGIPYIDVRYIIPTNTSGANTYPYFGMVTYLTAISGDKGITSAYFGIPSYSTTGGSCMVGFSTRSYDSSYGYLAETTRAFTTTAPYGYLQTAVLTHGATAAYSNSYIYINVPDGASCDITIRLGAYQLEKGSFATSYIPTSGAVATRAADNFTIPTGTWLNTSMSTLAGQANSRGIATGGAATVADINNDTFNQRFQIRFVSTNLFGGVITSSGTVQGSPNTTGYTYGTFGKLAMTAKANDAVLYGNGAASSSVSTLTMPVSQSQMRIGAAASGGEKLNGWIKNIQYYPARLANAQMILLTQ